MYRIGIDLGGTNTAAGLVDEYGQIVCRESVKTNLPTDLDRIVEDITGLCRTLMANCGLENGDIRSVGVGVPCTGNKQTGWMEDAHHLGFPGGPLVDRLKARLQLPVFIDNDANCAAWGEYKAGAYREDSFVLVTLGTGIGCGIILGGRLITGINNAAGEVGHMVIRAGGESCGCGRRGCFERYCSATALAHRASLLTGEQIPEAKIVFERAAAGEAAFAQLLDEYTTDLAEGLANIINLLGPAYVCIGGGVSHAGAQLLEPVREKTYARMLAQDAARKPQIILARLHNDAGILGAALLDQ